MIRKSKVLRMNSILISSFICHFLLNHWASFSRRQKPFHSLGSTNAPTRKWNVPFFLFDTFLWSTEGRMQFIELDRRIFFRDFFNLLCQGIFFPFKKPSPKKIKCVRLPFVSVRSESEKKAQRINFSCDP